jgi:hypothetical protein
MVASTKALQRTVAPPLEIGLQSGTPVNVGKKGNVVDLAKASLTSLPRRKRGVENAATNREIELGDLLGTACHENCDAEREDQEE